MSSNPVPPLWSVHPKRRCARLKRRSHWRRRTRRSERIRSRGRPPTSPTCAPVAGLSVDPWRWPVDDDLVSSVEDVLAAAIASARTPEVADRLREISARLRGPLRVAIAGKVKAGKSTLLNALLGEALAAVDASECTRIVTWYSRAPQPQVFMRFPDERWEPTPFRRIGGELEIDRRPVRGNGHVVIGGDRAASEGRSQIGNPAGDGIARCQRRRRELVECRDSALCASLRCRRALLRTRGGETD
jgi:hypothetical protein